MNRHDKTGTLRSKRISENLINHTLKIDNRPFWAQLSYVSEYLKHLNYFNLENKKEGQWNELIQYDPIIFMTIIINEPMFNLNELLTKYDSIKKNIEEKKKVVDILLEWAQKINSWQETLTSLGEDELATLIKNIAYDIISPHEKWLRHWKNKHSKIPEDSDYPSSIFKNPALGDNISNSLYLFVRIIIKIQETTKDYLENHLFSHGDHQPHSAMYIAFSILFKNIQNKQNKLPKKHLDFYYKDVLHQEPQEGEQVRSVVSFELLPSIKSSLIKKGAKLNAGKLFGSKNDILFETSQALNVEQVSIDKMQTLFFNSNPYINVGTKKPIIYNVEKKQLIDNGKAVDLKDDWFVFGANKESIQNTIIRPESSADIGFIIGSPVLILTEGRREIKLEIEFNIDSAVDSINDPFLTLLNQIKENWGISLNAVFSKIFYRGFTISYTSKTGWLDFEDMSLSYDEKNNLLTVLLVLENTEPALEKSDLKNTPELSWPSIKIILNEYAPVYLYSFLHNLVVNAINIDVQVKNMKNVTAYNSLGKVSILKPLDIFGPIPSIGSYLMIGKSELFQKEVSEVDINFDWDALPTVFNGFSSYYEGYSLPINNDSFKVDFTVLSNGYWLPTILDKPITLDLFNTENCISSEGYEGVKLKNSSSFKIQGFQDFETGENLNLKDPLPYSINTQSGFFKLTLCAPSFGFGSSIYQQEFTEIATFNAKNKEQLPLPKKPYVPKVKGISISYKASDKLLFKDYYSKGTSTQTNKGEYFHIRPSGNDPIIIDGKVTKFTLLPVFNSQGYLFLGFKGVSKTTTISLFFNLLRSSTTNLISESTIKWEYYEGNRWQKFEDEHILSDGTNGFVKSGIIEITLPILGNKEESLYWVRVSTRTSAEHYPKIKGVYLNAVEAICCSEDIEIIGKEIPEGSISKIEGQFPNIKNVVQPRSSFGGLLPEDQKDYYTRVSQRLRHKSRAVTHWDFEALILENFANVRIVKCTNLNKCFQPVPGKLSVVVLNSKWNKEERNYFKNESLLAMKTFLQKHSNPFVNINVINPTAEYLLVNCNFQFKDNISGGYYLEKLNNDISDFLSPDSTIDNSLIGIGGVIVLNKVKSFVENLSYIKGITKFTIEHIIKLPNYKFSLNIYCGDSLIEASKPWSIFLPVGQHRLFCTPLEKETECSMPIDNFGIGDMAIGSDFILQSDKESNTCRIKSKES